VPFDILLQNTRTFLAIFPNAAWHFAVLTVFSREKSFMRSAF
jgi:hypothetical protein